MSTASPAVHPPSRALRPVATIAAVILASVTVSACGGDDPARADAARDAGAKARDPKLCVVVEASGTTNDDEVKKNYRTSFSSAVDWFAAQQSDQPLCLILAVGNPTANPIATLQLQAPNPYDPDAATKVAANVRTAKAQFAQVLNAAVDPVGTPLVEALSALGTSGQLQAGDTVVVYSDMRQDTRNLQAFTLWRKDPSDQAAALNRALDGLAADGLLPGTGGGGGTLEGVRIVAPFPVASRTITGDASINARRVAAVQRFWPAWADRVGAKLEWGGSVG